MSLNDKLLKSAAAAAFVPSEHFGVMLYEGDGSSGHSINGGKFGAGGYFNGSNGQITLPDGIQNSNMSVSLWLYSNVNAPTDKIVIEFSNGYGLNFNTFGGGKIAAQYANSNSSHILSNSTISSGQWYHIVGVFNSSSASLYINGTSQSGGTVSDYLTSDQNTIGSRRTGQFFDGKIDQVRVFQKELSSSEVSTLYAETASTVESLDPLSEDTTDTLQVLGDTSCLALYKFESDETDVSGNYNGTGDAVQYGAGRYGQALQCNNSSTKVVIGTENSVIPNNTTGVSFSFWVNLDTINTGSDYDHWFVGQEDYGGSFGDGEFSVRLYEGKVYTDYGQSSSIYRQRKASTVLSTGRWYHIVATYDTSNANITEVYLNGVSETSSNITSGGTFTTTALMQNYSNISIGGGPTFTDGKIDQFRIFTKVLSASEVTTLYNENSLVASYRFEGNAYDDTRNYDGSASNVTYEYGLNFTPDFVWIKKRDATENHRLYDSTRGVSSSTNTLYPSLNFAASTESPNGLESFDTGGFTVANQNAVNSNGNDFVAWCFKANGGTTGSNTDGTITSTVQANQDAGFSIVSYTGSGSAGSVGHGISAGAPDLVIIKRLDGTTYWQVWYNGAGTSPASGINRLYLNDTQGNDSSTTNVFYPDATKINLNSGDHFFNTSSGNYIAYCFKSVDSFSKIGTYTGNGSNDGTFVEIGFEPAFVMVKDTTQAADWNIFDNKRNTHNSFPMIKTRLNANTSAAEGDQTGIKFYSNGFSVHSASNNVNYSGDTYIYMAFAADPDTEQPTVARSFAVKTYTGTGSSNSITGLGFQPNFLWIKSRTNTLFHNIFNSSIGANYVQYSNSNSAGETNANILSSFDTDGFTVGTDNSANQSGQDFVAWAWKADDNEPTINTNGSINSLVSANANAGFSIAKWTGTGSAGTVGHGLSSAPEMVITKRLSGTSDWYVYHKDLNGGTNPAYYFIKLNSTDAEILNASSAGSIWNSTSPSSTLINVGTTLSGSTSDSYIAYCFHSVTGYSKIGSYSTNASTKVSTGFRPDFILMKYRTSANNWFICDSVRSDGTTGSNGGDLVKPVLYGNLSNAEASVSTGSVEIVSDGFYPTNFFNSNGVLYMAFKIN